MQFPISSLKCLTLLLAALGMGGAALAQTAAQAPALSAAKGLNFADYLPTITDFLKLV